MQRVTNKYQILDYSDVFFMMIEHYCSVFFIVSYRRAIQQRHNTTLTPAAWRIWIFCMVISAGNPIPVLHQSDFGQEHHIPALSFIEISGTFELQLVPTLLTTGPQLCLRSYVGRLYKAKHQIKSGGGKSSERKFFFLLLSFCFSYRIETRHHPSSVRQGYS